MVDLTPAQQLESYRQLAERREAVATELRQNTQRRAASPGRWALGRFGARLSFGYSFGVARSSGALLVLFWRSIWISRIWEFKARLGRISKF